MTGERSNRFLLTLFGMQKARTKGHIFLIILIHAAGWCLFFFLPLLLFPVRINSSRFIIPELIDKSFLVLLFYINYYLLITRLFEKRKYLFYFLLTFFAFIIYLSQYVIVRDKFLTARGGPFRLVHFAGAPELRRDSFIRAIGFYGISNEDPNARAFETRKFDSNSTVLTNSPDSVIRTMPEFPPEEESFLGIPKRMWLMTLNNAVSSFILLFLLGGFIRLAFSFIRNQNEKKLLENAKLNAEVNFLKSQINPHFLFNTLNSVYAQAHSKSDKTEISILKLSELLRYMLYDSGANKVELAKDIQYINNYIDLQQLRLSSKVKINYSVKGKLNGYHIAPLMLITFIENAFKHGISYSHSSSIDIEIKIIDETLTLLVSNPVLQSNTFADGGLGLKNVTRRLELLYPDKYQLLIRLENNHHIVNLNLDLKSDKLLIN
jgi:sensor histidine kinase YesM